MNFSPHQDIKIYLRLKDKKSFPLNLNNPVALADLHQLILKKTKIPSHDLIVMHLGKQIHFSHKSQLIYFKDKSILHIIDKKNLRNDIIEISVKFIIRNKEKACLGKTELFAKCQESIKEFIHSKVIPAIEQRTQQKICIDDLNMVLNGMLLQKQLNFHDYLVENGSQIICMINTSEALQKSVHNVSIHNIFVSNQQKHVQGKKQIKNQQELKNLSLKLSAHKRKLQVDKKTSLPLSQHRSQEFMKLETFESKNEIVQKERLLNEVLQYESKGKKLKKKLKITSDLASNYEHKCKQESDQQNQGLLEDDQQVSNPEMEKKDGIADTKTKAFKKLSIDISDLENKNEVNFWNKDADSPINIQYPMIQRRGPYWIEWDPTIALQSAEQKTTEIKTLQNKPQQINSEKESFKLIFHGVQEKQHKHNKDCIDELNQKFTNLIKQRKLESQSQTIFVKYSKIETNEGPKLGDFLISDSLQGQPQTMMNEQAVQKLSEIIKKKGNKQNIGQKIRRKVSKIVGKLNGPNKN